MSEEWAWYRGVVECTGARRSAGLMSTLKIIDIGGTATACTLVSLVCGRVNRTCNRFEVYL